MTAAKLSVRAVRTRQGGNDVFAFFIPGYRLLELAEISKLEADPEGKLSGFQRPEIRSHIRNITEYVNRGAVLFPNAIILALAPGAQFKATRGTKVSGSDPSGEAGTLYLPIMAGRKVAWIVDGQQRSLALKDARNAQLNVPVVAFVSGDIAVHREQFILVNKAKPLSPRLIDELLPEVGAVLPRELSTRRVPSMLCNILNTSLDSPFYGLVKRPSSAVKDGVVLDSVLIKMMKRSIQDPRGALAMHVSSDGGSDIDEMYKVLVAYWSAVRHVFSYAWGKPPDQSRLMHAAGIEAMGVLMDQILNRSDTADNARTYCEKILKKIEPACRWTSGRWELLDRAWNDIQYTPKDVRALSNFLLSQERQVIRVVA
jgi:DGQHR domain-containing protein